MTVDTKRLRSAALSLSCLRYGDMADALREAADEIDRLSAISVGVKVGAEKPALCEDWRTKAADEVEAIASLWDVEGRLYAEGIATALRAEEPDPLPPMDAETKRVVSRAWDRFRAGIAMGQPPSEVGVNVGVNGSTPAPVSTTSTL